MMKVDWESTALQELDISATDLSTECLIDMLVRIPGLRYLAAGQINGFNDSVSYGEKISIIRFILKREWFTGVEGLHGTWKCEKLNSTGS